MCVWYPITGAMCVKYLIKDARCVKSSYKRCKVCEMHYKCQECQTTGNTTVERQKTIQ